MTKVQRHFQLQRPIDEPLMEQIAHVNSIYGIERIRIEPSGNLMVEYDATRLNSSMVTQLVRRSGLQLIEELPAPEPIVLPEVVPTAPVLDTKPGTPVNASPQTLPPPASPPKPAGAAPLP